MTEKQLMGEEAKLAAKEAALPIVQKYQQYMNLDQFGLNRIVCQAASGSMRLIR